MFLPNNNAQALQDAKKQQIARVEGLALQLVPEDIRPEAQIVAQEVQCGDPTCSPIDVIVTVLFNRGGRGMLSLPMEANEVTVEELQQCFPTETVLRKWQQGEEAEWPPPEMMDDDDEQMPPVRFQVNDRVLCRIGPQEWAKGVITKLWYRENNWPMNSWAPYKVTLDDGRNIFAPGDMDQIIKKDTDA